MLYEKDNSIKFCVKVEREREKNEKNINKQKY